MRITEQTQRMIVIEMQEDEADRFLLAFDRTLQNGDRPTPEQERKDHDILTSFYNDLSEAVGEVPNG